MNPIEFHPFEMQFEVPGTDGQTVYTRRFQAIICPFFPPISILDH